MEVSGGWTTEELTTSINVRELKTILFALKMHAEEFRGENIRVFTDNVTALKYSTKAGGTASPLLQELAINIQEVINSYNLTVTYSHVPGVLNVKADVLSRKKSTNLLYEATMPKKWFQTINQRMGPLKIDGFAARHNTKLKTFWSYQPDPEAKAMDAFQQTWYAIKKLDGVLDSSTNTITFKNGLHFPLAESKPVSTEPSTNEINNAIKKLDGVLDRLADSLARRIASKTSCRSFRCCSKSGPKKGLYLFPPLI